jgi:hypothetical protein
MIDLGAGRTRKMEEILDEKEPQRMQVPNLHIKYSEILD